MDFINDAFVCKANFIYPIECSYLQAATCATVQYQGAVFINKVWVRTREPQC